ncbi:CubicO group peptidase (beta-lactamase class C family) [Arthrobacter sp. CAN_C5]|nr:CubicO group peptidase (beta-lactamase class C family) [Arthrobacter sp. CAN_C5]
MWLVVIGVLICVALTFSTTRAHAGAPDTLDIAAIDGFLENQMRSAAIPGLAVAITQGDRVVHVRGFGHDSQGRPVTGDTPFRIASLSKSFTSLAVLQLVDAGLVSLDDPVIAHLPEFRLNDPRGSDITVRQLLDHTTGLADSTSPDLSRNQPDTLAEATAALTAVDLVAMPGAQWNYHNPNYEIAARLVEVVSGETFEHYLQRHVFQPIGMISSVTTKTDNERVEGLADGHVALYGTPVGMRGPGLFAAGSGGVVSTASDMARWLAVQTNYGMSADGSRILSKQGLISMHTPSAPNGYALGWDTDGPVAAPTRLEHSGNLLTFSAFQVLLPSDDIGVALLFNSSTAFLDEQSAIISRVIDLIEGADVPPSDTLTRTNVMNAILALLTVVGVALGARLTMLSRRWASRSGASRTRLALSTVPFVAVVGLCAAFPRLAELAYGREVTWVAAAYGWPALVIFVLSTGLAALIVLSTRVLRLHQRRRASKHPATAGRPVPPPM